MRLLNAIDQGRHSFEDLKDHIAEGGRRPSTRRLRRYLAILADAGFPLYFDRAANVYRFADGYSLKRLDLSSGELFGLVALRSLGASIGGTIGASIDEVAEKLVGSAGSRRARAESKPARRSRFGSPRSASTSGASAPSRCSRRPSAARAACASPIAIRRATRSTRTVDPYGFIINAGRVYCVAYDHTRRDKRTFAVDSVERTGRPRAERSFGPRDFNIEEYAAASISGVLHADANDRGARRFAPRVAKAAAAARDRRRARGGAPRRRSVEIVYRVADVDELVRWVLGWGAQAEILDPPEARDAHRRNSPRKSPPNIILAR